MENGTIGRRWARALVASLESEGDLRAVDEQLGALAALVEDRGSDLRAAMLHPGFTAAERAAVLEQIAETHGFHPMTRRFLALLVQKDRLPYLPPIAKALRELVDERLGRVRALIESANELKAAEVDDVVAALKKRSGKDVVADVRTDPALIAGLRARIGGLVFDNTVRAKLDRMRHELSH